MIGRDAANLLGLGRALACGDLQLPGTSGPRGACIIARQALEQVVAELLQARGLECAQATMRTKLICLRQSYAAEPGLVFQAETAWWRLSVACHHHAFELAPTPTQALVLVEDVARLASAAQDRRGTQAISGSPTP